MNGKEMQRGKILTLETHIQKAKKKEHMKSICVLCTWKLGTKEKCKDVE